MSSEILAKVGDITITNADIQRVIDSFPEAQRDYLSTPDGRERILNQKIANCVMALAAKDAGKVLTPEFETMKADFEEQFLSQQEIDEAVKAIEITEEELKNYYEDCKETFRSEEQVQAKHILVDTLEQCQEIRNKITSGEMSFEDAAKQFSTCPSSADGGDLGFFGHGQMVGEFDEAAFDAALNEVTEPVKTQFGYHLIKVVDKKDAAIVPFEEVAPQIREQMYKMKEDEVIVTKIEVLKGQYGEIEVDETAIDRLIAQYPQQHQSYLATEEGRNGVREQKKAYIVLTRSAKEKGRDKEEGYFAAMNDFEEQMLAQQMIQDLFDNIVITDEDAQKYYDVTISQYRIPEQVQAKHILVDSLEKAQAIREQILSGAISFEDAAKENSTCPSSADGGDLGFFGHGQMVKEFDEAAFAAALNEVTEPVQTQFGYHLIKVVDKKEASVKPFEEVKGQIMQQMSDQRKNEAYFGKVEELKEKFGVELV